MELLMRTAGMLLMDTPLPDGQIFVATGDIIPTPTYTRVGKGLLAATAPVSATTVFSFPLSGILARYGMSDDAQQVFGKANPSGGFQGAQAQAVTATTPFTTPYQAGGRPPFAGNAFFVPPTGRPKGVAINVATVVYQVNGAAATSLTFGISNTQFTAGVGVPVVTDIIAPSAAGFNVAVSASVTTNPFVNAVQNQFLTGNLAEVVGELTVVTPAASTVNFFGVFLNVAFNYN
jgi:hypothetical protein